MSIYGTLCGFTNFFNMCDFLDLKNDILSHDTFSRVFSLINPKQFMELFIKWINDIINEKGLHIAIDGKAIKSAKDKINGGNIPYILSDFLCDLGISIGQLKIKDKSNEITLIKIFIKGKSSLFYL